MIVTNAVREVGRVRHASSLSSKMRVSRMRERGRVSPQSIGVEDDVGGSVTLPGEDSFSSSAQEALTRAGFID